MSGLPPKSTPEIEENENAIPIADFLNEWGEKLKEKVLQSVNPGYQSSKEDSWDINLRKKFQVLTKPPFEAQLRKIILPAARGLYKDDQKAINIVGEMGTGKTVMALALAFADPKENKRVLIQCPGHLVAKWIREAYQIIPGIKVVDFNKPGLGNLTTYKNKSVKPNGMELWVIGKERSKLHYQRKIQTVLRRQKEGFYESCPICGKEIEYRETCKAPKCEHCGEKMWSADRKKTRRFAKAEFVKRYLPNNFFDLCILDEVHELKGGGSAQGQAMACLVAKSRKILSLTGTVMGGYSKDMFFLLWRMFPRAMEKLDFEYGNTMSFARRYGVIERTYRNGKEIEIDEDTFNDASIGRKLSRFRTSEKPGISPQLFPDLLLEHSVFIRLSDVSDELPDYDEIVVSVDMEEKQKEQYKKLESELQNAIVKARSNGDNRVMGKMLQSLLAYPDGCRKGEVVYLDDEVIAEAEVLNKNTLPKEEKLLEILRSEKLEGRKTAIFLEHTGTRNLIPTLVTKLESEGFKPLVMLAETVPPVKREEWLIEKLENGDYDCLICNPRLVQTGLDLLDFPTIVFYQCGYSAFTLRQASRRSWRIGQTEAVRVFFMLYKETLSSVALSLMAQKMETSLAVEGELSEKGLAAMSESENSMVMEMALALSGKTAVKDATEAWESYRHREISSNLELDADVTSETTTSQNVSKYEYIFRGRIYPRKNGAVAYVDGTKYHLQNGEIFWNDKPVGQYGKRGLGKIGTKRIHIYCPPGERYWVLSELTEIKEAA